ncbi:hypothetical protein Y032_0092g2602 [Ancylostoma ceylanicum]|uniref:Small ribosomal subunit protein mS29 n=1 Tax=Ancylostoma ceylanicum TaxID=53326 RepID=A0A016TM53_9BILA|nr:hypothetical protein Y032_0092g2602 [Ancylostoma ceylanicum]
MKCVLRPVFSRMGAPIGRIKSRRLYMTERSGPTEFSISDVGRLYEIPREAVTSLGYERLLPSNMIKQTDTLGELVTVIREPLIEVSSCMSVARPSFPSLRMVLWGPFGTGKSVTVNQSVHLAYTQSMVIVQLHSGE